MPRPDVHGRTDHLDYRSERRRLVVLVIGAQATRAVQLTRAAIRGATVRDVFFPSALPKQVVLGLWNECADKLRIPASQLRPTDRFKQELAVANFWASLDDPRDDLAHFVRKFVKERSAGIDLANVKTVGQLVDQLARLEVGGPS
jgi:hypothetical protein